MIWFATLIGLGVFAITAYQQLHRQDAAAAERFIETLRAITAVVVALGQAVVGAADALSRPIPSYAYTAPSRRYPSWDAFDE